MTTVGPDAKLAAAGEREAFEKIYRRYHYGLLSLPADDQERVPG